MSGRRHALVLGGTGAVGSRVVAMLAARGVPTTFTFHTAEAKAAAIAGAHGATPMRVDLASEAAIAELFVNLDARGVVPDVVLHTAAVHRPAALAEVTADDFDRAVAISGRAGLLVVRELAKRLPAAGAVPPAPVAHVVFVGALDRTQSLPLPAPFAAAQGMLGPLAMALAKELGKQGVLVNLVAGGLVADGISRGLDAALVADFQKFSALRRVGQPDELAAPAVFLALDNAHMTGKVLAANGGI